MTEHGKQADEAQLEALLEEIRPVTEAEAREYAAILEWEENGGLDDDD